MIPPPIEANDEEQQPKNSKRERNYSFNDEIQQKASDKLKQKQKSMKKRKSQKRSSNNVKYEEKEVPLNMDDDKPKEGLPVEKRKGKLGSAYVVKHGI